MAKLFSRHLSTLSGFCFGVDIGGRRQRTKSQSLGPLSSARAPHPPRVRARTKKSARAHRARKQRTKKPSIGRDCQAESYILNLVQLKVPIINISNFSFSPEKKSFGSKSAGFFFIKQSL
jgi:hypothetical protein